MQVKLTALGEAMGRGGDWDQAAVISFSCSLFLSLFSLCSCLLVPLLWAYPWDTVPSGSMVCLSTGHKSLQVFACGNVFIHWLQFLQGYCQLYHESIPSAMVPYSISFSCLTSLNMFLQVPPTLWWAQICPSITPLKVIDQLCLA